MRSPRSCSTQEPRLKSELPELTPISSSSSRWIPGMYQVALAGRANAQGTCCRLGSDLARVAAYDCSNARPRVDGTRRASRVPPCASPSHAASRSAAGSPAWVALHHASGCYRAAPRSVGQLSSWLPVAATLYRPVCRSQAE
eukprot:scaffold14063_cov66-Phaeocystis_antarctica.AAC.2